MPGQLEDAEDANESHDAKDGEAATSAAAAARTAPDQGDEIRRDGDDVDDVHGVAKVETSVGTRQEADAEFEAEPNDAARLERVEMIGRQTQSYGRRSLNRAGRRRLTDVYEEVAIVRETAVGVTSCSSSSYLVIFANRISVSNHGIWILALESRQRLETKYEDRK